MAIVDVGYRPKVGEELIVEIPSYGHGRPPTVVRATAVKVAREWVTLELGEGGHLRDPRFRIRTQHTENNTNYNSRYYNEKQWAASEELKAARLLFKRYGIEFGWGSGFGENKNPERFLKLAELIRKMIEEEGGTP